MKFHRICLDVFFMKLRIGHFFYSFILYLYLISDLLLFWVMLTSVWMVHLKPLTIPLTNTALTSRRRQWQPTPVLLSGKSHGRRDLVGCRPWGCKELDMTERLPFHFSRIGEGNDNPLHCSCLENPRDGRAWWAAIYGVAQSQTRLTRLSSSSSTY